MQSYAAIETLKNISYKPGWRFDAASASELGFQQRFLLALETGYDVTDDTVLFHWESDTVDTDKEYAREGYPKAKELDGVVPFDASEFASEEELLFAIFQRVIMPLELHEAREFFRCKNHDYEAPFHPHKVEGNDAWDRCVTQLETN